MGSMQAMDPTQDSIKNDIMLYNLWFATNYTYFYYI